MKNIAELNQKEVSVVAGGNGEAVVYTMVLVTFVIGGIAGWIVRGLYDNAIIVERLDGIEDGVKGLKEDVSELQSSVEEIKNPEGCPAKG